MEENIVSEIFKEGDWVQIDDGSLRGYTGFIIKCDYDFDEYRIQLTKNKKGEPYKGKPVIEGCNLKHIQDVLDEDFLLGLIDTTLFLKQKEWFMELTEKLPLNNF